MPVGYKKDGSFSGKIFKKGHKGGGFTGKHHSEKSKKKIGECLTQYAEEKSWNWKGGKRKDGRGYILVYKPNHPFTTESRCVREHRFIIEQHLGRFLKPSEHCHHINKIRDDNRPENLMAFVNQSAHQKFHRNPNNVKPEEIVFDGREL